MNNNNTQPRQLRKVSQKYTRQSQLAMVMHNLAKNKGAMAGLVLIAVIALVAIFADFLYDYDEVVIKVNLAESSSLLVWSIPAALTTWAVTFWLVSFTVPATLWLLAWQQPCLA